MFIRCLHNLIFRTGDRTSYIRFARLGGAWVMWVLTGRRCWEPSAAKRLRTDRVGGSCGQHYNQIRGATTRTPTRRVVETIVDDTALLRESEAVLAAISSSRITMLPHVTKYFFVRLKENIFLVVLVMEIYIYRNCCLNTQFDDNMF